MIIVQWRKQAKANQMADNYSDESLGEVRFLVDAATHF